MKIKTSEQSDLTLDLAVAKCKGITGLVLRGTYLHYPPGQFSDEEAYSPSTDWELGGPIVDMLIEEGWTFAKADFNLGIKCFRFVEGDIQYQYGATILIAAMRSFVFGRLGNEVEFPEAICHTKSTQRVHVRPF